MVVFLQRNCIRVKMVVIGQKWFYSGKSFTRVKVVNLRQKFCIFQAKVLVFGQSGCIRATWLYSG